MADIVFKKCVSLYFSYLCIL